MLLTAQSFGPQGKQVIKSAINYILLDSETIVPGDMPLDMFIEQVLVPQMCQWLVALDTGSSLADAMTILNDSADFGLLQFDNNVAHINSSWSFLDTCVYINGLTEQEKGLIDSGSYHTWLQELNNFGLQDDCTYGEWYMKQMEPFMHGFLTN